MARSSDITATWERLVRFHREATAAMDARLRAECGHSLADYDVLHQIRAHDGPIRMGDLAQRLLIANSSCHRIVGRLAEAGLVERDHLSTDRREVHVRLSPAGHRQWRRMAAVHTRDIEHALGEPLSDDERTQLDEILRHLLTTRPD